MRLFTYKLCFSTGNVHTVHCSRHELDSIVLNYLSCCNTLDHRVTYCNVFQVIGYLKFRFVRKFGFV